MTYHPRNVPPALVATILLVAACASSHGSPGTNSEEARSGLGPVLSAIADHQASASAERIYESVYEMVPSVTFVVDGESRIVVTDAVLVGRIVDVEQGRSFSWTEDADDERRVEVPFNDAKAMSSTVHLVVQIDEVVGAANTFDQERGESVRVGVSLGPQVDVESARKELSDLGSVVVFIKGNNPALDYDKSLFSICEQGGMLGAIHADDSITFPALDAYWLVPEDLDLPALREASATPVEIAVVTRDGSWSRPDS
jgi:hypothetical protein